MRRRKRGKAGKSSVAEETPVQGLARRLIEFNQRYTELENIFPDFISYLDGLDLDSLGGGVSSGPYSPYGIMKEAVLSLKVFFDKGETGLDTFNKLFKSLMTAAEEHGVNIHAARDRKAGNIFELESLIQKVEAGIRRCDLARASLISYCSSNKSLFIAGTKTATTYQAALRQNPLVIFGALKKDIKPVHKEEFVLATQDATFIGAKVSLDTATVPILKEAAAAPAPVRTADKAARNFGTHLALYLVAKSRGEVLLGVGSLINNLLKSHADAKKSGVFKEGMGNSINNLASSDSAASVLFEEIQGWIKEDYKMAFLNAYRKPIIASKSKVMSGAAAAAAPRAPRVPRGSSNGGAAAAAAPAHRKRPVGAAAAAAPPTAAEQAEMAQFMVESKAATASGPGIPAFQKIIGAAAVDSAIAAAGIAASGPAAVQPAEIPDLEAQLRELMADDDGVPPMPTEPPPPPPATRKLPPPPPPPPGSGPQRLFARPRLNPVQSRGSKPLPIASNTVNSTLQELDKIPADHVAKVQGKAEKYKNAKNFRENFAKAFLSLQELRSTLNDFSGRVLEGGTFVRKAYERLQGHMGTLMGVNKKLPNYDDAIKNFPALIGAVNGVLINVMTAPSKGWKWPDRSDINPFVVDRSIDLDEVAAAPAPQPAAAPPSPSDAAAAPDELYGTPQDSASLAERQDALRVLIDQMDASEYEYVAGSIGDISVKEFQFGGATHYVEKRGNKIVIGYYKGVDEGTEIITIFVSDTTLDFTINSTTLDGNQACKIVKELGTQESILRDDAAAAGPAAPGRSPQSSASGSPASSSSGRLTPEKLLALNAFAREIRSRNNLFDNLRLQSDQQCLSHAVEFKKTIYGILKTERGENPTENDVNNECKELLKNVAPETEGTAINQAELLALFNSMCDKYNSIGIRIDNQQARLDAIQEVSLYFTDREVANKDKFNNAIQEYSILVYEDLVFNSDVRGAEEFTALATVQSDIDERKSRQRATVPDRDGSPADVFSQTFLEYVRGGEFARVAKEAQVARHRAAQTARGSVPRAPDDVDLRRLATGGGRRRGHDGSPTAGPPAPPPPPAAAAAAPPPPAPLRPVATDLDDSPPGSPTGSDASGPYEPAAAGLGSPTAGPRDSGPIDLAAAGRVPPPGSRTPTPIDQLTSPEPPAAADGPTYDAAAGGSGVLGPDGLPREEAIYDAAAGGRVTPTGSDAGSDASSPTYDLAAAGPGSPTAGPPPAPPTPPPAKEEVPQETINEMFRRLAALRGNHRGSPPTPPPPAGPRRERRAPTPPPPARPRFRIPPPPAPPHVRIDDIKDLGQTIQAQLISLGIGALQSLTVSNGEENSALTKAYGDNEGLEDIVEKAKELIDKSSIDDVNQDSFLQSVREFNGKVTAYLNGKVDFSSYKVFGGFQNKEELPSPSRADNNLRGNIELAKYLITALCQHYKSQQPKYENPLQAVYEYINRKNPIITPGVIDNGVAKFANAINQNRENPNPTTPYRGIGVKAIVVETNRVKSLRIDDVYSSNIKRFKQNGANIGSDILKGGLITQIKIDGVDTDINALLNQEDGAAIIAKAFHSQGQVEFTMTKNGVEYNMTCDNTKNKSAIYAPTIENTPNNRKFAALSEMIKVEAGPEVRKYAGALIANTVIRGENPKPAPASPTADPLAPGLVQVSMV